MKPGRGEASGKSFHTVPGSPLLAPDELFRGVAQRSNLHLKPTRRSTLLPFPPSCSCRAQAQPQASTTVAPAPTTPQPSPSSDSLPGTSSQPPSDEQLRSSFRFLPRQLHVFEELQVAMRSCSQALAALAVGNVVANAVEVRRGACGGAQGTFGYGPSAVIAKFGNWGMPGTLTARAMEGSGGRGMKHVGEAGGGCRLG